MQLAPAQPLGGGGGGGGGGRRGISNIRGSWRPHIEMTSLVLPLTVEQLLSNTSELRLFHTIRGPVKTLRNG